MRTPVASATALAMAGAPGATRPLPDAAPVVGPRADLRRQQHRGERRDVARRRQLEVAEGDVGDAPVLHLQLLHERVADAGDDGAVDLSLVADGVDDGADVVGGGEAEELDFARLWIDRDLGALGGEAGRVDTGRLVDVGARPHRLAPAGG